LEVTLRLAGFGHPVGFLLPDRIRGQDVVVQNDRFAWRFFGRDLARVPFPLVIPKVKPSETVRIFVFGESAAYGDPQPDFGLPRMLEVLLRERYPNRHFEVVNAAMTAINSHAIVPIARDCAEQQGDIWVVYMGNNEVVGPFGAGTVFGPRVPPLPLIRASLTLKATRTGQLLDQVLDRIHPHPDSMREWGGMSMFLGSQVRQTDPRMTSVYAHFRRNLQDALQAGERVGAHIVLSTMASNLKDCPPFASLHTPELSPAVLSDWEKLYRQALEAAQQGQPSEAIDLLSQAERLDAGYAELHYVWGRCCLALGRDSEALAHYTKARDLDTLRFRADSKINALIRETAQLSSGTVRVVDSEQIMAAQSSHGVPGEEFFYEHVHLNFEGNYALALALAEEVTKLLPNLGDVRSERSWPSLATCAQRLAWNDSTKYEAKRLILSRVNDPPFTTQFDHVGHLGRLRRDLDQLSTANSQAGLTKAVRRCELARAASGGDWVLSEGLALAQEKIGDFAEASKAWHEVLEFVPHYTEAWQQLGRDLAAQNLNAEAISALRHALTLEPSSVQARTALAQVIFQQNEIAQSIREYELALRLKRYWGPAHLGLGKALEAAGRTAEAELHFRKALQSRVYNPAALSALGRFCFEKGWLNEAVTNFTDSLNLDPSDARTHVNLGVVLVGLDRRAEARSHFTEALRLDPNLAEAHVRLGFQFGTEGRDAEALGHFAEAVRLKPDLLEARLNLGIALLKQGRQAEAITQFNEVLRRDPGNHVALKKLQQLDQK
jgi:tetratricopeptide (TPR) repeat protein